MKANPSSNMQALMHLLLGSLLRWDSCCWRGQASTVQRYTGGRRSKVSPISRQQTFSTSLGSTIVLQGTDASSWHQAVSHAANLQSLLLLVTHTCQREALREGGCSMRDLVVSARVPSACYDWVRQALAEACVWHGVPMSERKER
jgi:hypothetical protein